VLDIYSGVKLRMMRRKGYVESLQETRNACNISIGNLERKWPLGRSMRGWDPREIGCEDEE
jgi:hypothetical protein